MLTFLAAALLVTPLAQASAAQSAGRTAPSPLAPTEIVAKAPAADWVAIAPADMLVMDLAPDAAGRARRVVIQLMPAPFSQGWVGNIRKLAAAHWWDGTSVNRVQDNYVTQWGDATEKKALPAGLEVTPQGEYETDTDRAEAMSTESWVGIDGKGAQVETYKVTGHLVTNWRLGAYGTDGNWDGWPVGISDTGQGRKRVRRTWPVHCYAMVGVGRNLPPDTGNGAELYTVIGHAPRHLDRNIALVGRVIAGIEHLSSLPRGTEALGFYKTAGERTPILRIRLASELPAAERPRFEYLSTESDSFARYAEARANRKDAFFIRPAGGADICNVPVPVQAVR